MIKNFLKIALRNLWRDKFFSLLNISGLAIGIACCLLIMTYVNYELSFDKHFENSENIHRIIISGSFNGDSFTGSQAPAPAGGTFKDQVPGVAQRMRLRNSGNWVMKYEEKVFNENNVVYADETFFDVFSIPLLMGNPDDVLLNKNTLAMSESMAKKYFGDEDPMGKIIRLDNRVDYEVRGVYADIPDNTHFSFDFLLSFITRENEYNDQQWLSTNYETYLVLDQNVNTEQVLANINEIAVDKMGVELKQYLDMSFDDFKKAGNNFEYMLQPLHDIHLRSDNYGGYEAEGDITYVYIFTAIAAFILALACINFMNLSTARSANRAKEVGIRKVMGSFRAQIIYQFISESILITFLAGLIGLALATVLIPFFNDFADRQMELSFAANLPLVLIGSMVVGFLAGLYPAFFLSAFSPAKVLKGNLSTGMKSGGLRKVLVTFQFFVSILLIIGTFSILNQLSYIQNKKLGFEKDQVMVVHNAFMLRDNTEAFRNALLQNADIENAAYSSFLPTTSSRSNTVFFPDAVIDQEKGVLSQNWSVDYEYVDVFGLEVVDGRFFSREYATDSMAMVINETAAQMFGIENLEGAVIGDFNDDGSALDRYKVVGIVKDFHFESLKDKIRPVIMRLGNSTGLVSLKVNTTNMQATMDRVERSWNELAPGQPFEYSFLDDRFTNMYQAESRLGDIFSVFAGLAIVIACLGLFGLAAFTAQQKTKEVGIRKVLGASMVQLVYLMSREVSVLIIISFVVASGLGWLGVDWWMQSFSYRPPINIGVFLLAGVGAFVIALLTMSYQSIKVAIANPVKALRNE